MKQFVLFLILLGTVRAQTPTEPATASPELDDPTKAAVDLIYEKLDELFGDKVQLFSMEFPGRVLDEASYYYNVSSSSSQFVKPQTVAEEEFRLTDSLFDVSQISGGPNGESLSTVYEYSINRLLPIWQDGNFRNDKEATRKWLSSLTSAPPGHEDVHPATSEPVDCDKVLEGFDNLYTAYESASSPKISLMDLHTRLATRYNNMKLTWNICKLQKMDEALNTPETNDEFFRWVAIVGDSAKAKIDSYWEDLVVRGYHHDVKEALGIIDRSSASELIEDARNNMRFSEVRSIDGSKKIYPVEMQPANWAQSLTTHFTPKDLLMDYDSLTLQVNQVQEQINTLSLQLSLLRQAKEGDVASLQAEVKTQEEAVAKAQTDLVEQYGSAIASVAKMYLENKYGDGSTVPSGDKAVVETDINNKLRDELGKPPLTTEQVDELLNLWDKTANDQQQLTQANQALTKLSAALAAAHTTDYAQAIAVLSEQISTQSSRLRNLQNFLSMAGKDASTNPGAQNMSFVPSMPDPGPWEQVVMSFTSSQVRRSSSLAKSASHTSWNFDLIFASGSGSSSDSESDSAQSFSASEVDMKIGFEATKVTIDRGGWFAPDIFRRSKDFMHVDVEGPPISSGPPDDMKSLPQSAVTAYLNDYFPAYPVAFVIARDITIQITASEEISDATKSYLHHESSSSGGFLCFSYATSKSSTDQSSSFYHAASGKTISIKIPGSQILGWYLEFVPKDESMPYQKMPEGYWPPVSSDSGSEASSRGIEVDSSPASRGKDILVKNGVFCTFPSEIMYPTITAKQMDCILNVQGLHKSSSNTYVFFSKDEASSDLAHFTGEKPGPGQGYGRAHFTCRAGLGDKEKKDSRNIPVNVGRTAIENWLESCCDFKFVDAEGKQRDMKSVISYVISEIMPCLE